VLPLPAVVLCIVFSVLAGIHVFWAFSGRLDGSAVIPTVDGAPTMRPGKSATLAVAGLLAAAAAVSLWRGGWSAGGPAWVPRIGIWIIAFVFAARAIGEFRYVGFFKKIRGTAFARNDTLYFAPLCLVISVLAVWLAVFY
jgi:hypothetical protein